MSVVTLVTGASSGIGRSLARRLAASGDPVAVMARRADLLESLAAEIAADGGTALAVAGDVTDRARVHEIVREVERHLGPIGRLIANAGGGEPTHVEEFSALQIEQVIALNVVGAANCIEAVLPGMLARGTGHLVATSSLAAYRGLPSAAAYSSAKAALTNLMESLRIDLRRRGIVVTVISPGFVRVKPTAKKRKPFQLDVERATELMHRAIVQQRATYAFPAPMAFAVGLGWHLPAAAYDGLVGGRGRTRKRPT